MDIVMLAVGCGLAGLGLGITVNHFLVSRPLTQRIEKMRYVGFVGDAIPEWEPVPTISVRED